MGICVSVAWLAISANKITQGTSFFFFFSPSINSAFVSLYILLLGLLVTMVMKVLESLKREGSKTNALLKRCGCR